MNRAVIYLRVSTRQQTESSQLEPCKEFCKQKGFDIVAIKKDHGKSAYKSIVRSGYNDVIDMVKNKQVEHIVVWALDRWTRRGHRELMNTITYLEKYNVQLHSVKEQWIDDITQGDLSFVRDIVLNVLGWMAEQESKKISQRIKTSDKYQKAKRNGDVGRPSILEQVESKVVEYLNAGKSYRWIRDNVTYKAKHGKVKHVSIATISHINKALKNGKKNHNKENTIKSSV